MHLFIGIVVFIRTSCSYLQKSLSLQYFHWKFQTRKQDIDNSSILSEFTRKLGIDIGYGK